MKSSIDKKYINFLRNEIPNDGCLLKISYECPSSKSGANRSTHTLLANLEDSNIVVLTFFRFSGRNIDRTEVTLEKSANFTNAHLVEYADYHEERICKEKYRTSGQIRWSRDEDVIDDCRELRVHLLSEEDAMSALAFQLDHAMIQRPRSQDPGRG